MRTRNGILHTHDAPVVLEAGRPDRDRKRYQPRRADLLRDRTKTARWTKTVQRYAEKQGTMKRAVMRAGLRDVTK